MIYTEEYYRKLVPIAGECVGKTPELPGTEFKVEVGGFAFYGQREGGKLRLYVQTVGSDQRERISRNGLIPEQCPLEILIKGLEELAIRSTEKTIYFGLLMMLENYLQKLTLIRQHGVLPLREFAIGDTMFLFAQVGGRITIDATHPGRPQAHLDPMQPPPGEYPREELVSNLKEAIRHVVGLIREELDLWQSGFQELDKTLHQFPDNSSDFLERLRKN